MKVDNKVIYVILRNKIIGIDSILPTCVEIHGRCGYMFNFISLDYSTYKYIMEDNIVLRDAIHSIGKIELLSSDRYKSRYISKLFFIFYFVKVMFNIAVRNDYIMHSAHLHVNPFVWVRWLFKKSNIIFMEKQSFGIEKAIDFTNVKNRDLKFLYNKRLTYDEISKYGIDIYSHPPLLYAGVLIGYDKRWNYFKHPTASRLKKIVLKDMRSNRYWISFIKKNAHKYIESEMPVGDFKSGNILVFIATRITRTTDINAIEEFVGALNVLFKYTHIFPLFIKLHTFSDVEFINELVNTALGKENSARYVFTKLHPAVLATRAVISVFANSGTLMKEFSEFDIPVVDLQIYEDILSPSHVSLSINLSKSNLEKRYKERKNLSDYTFTDVYNFDKFMEKIVNTSSKLDGIKPLVDNSQKYISHIESCNFSKKNIAEDIGNIKSLISRTL
jgi:hypothetical protein